MQEEIIRDANAADAFKCLTAAIATLYVRQLDVSTYLLYNNRHDKFTHNLIIIILPW